MAETIFQTFQTSTKYRYHPSLGRGPVETCSRGGLKQTGRAGGHEDEESSQIKSNQRERHHALDDWVTGNDEVSGVGEYCVLSIAQNVGSCAIPS